MHVGICRSSDTDESAVLENIKKARRTMYNVQPNAVRSAWREWTRPRDIMRLMCYLYCYMEWRLCFPHPKVIEKLDKFLNKHNLKHILSLPITTADPAVYKLSGTLPIEAMILQRVLTFFGNITRLPESSIENQLAVRQLTVKTLDSNSWFVAVGTLCNMYGLSDCVDLLDTPPPH